MPVVLYAEDTGLGDGDPVAALPGTGKAVPWGVEATFQYNNLILNDRHNVDKYRITSIDGLDDADVRDSREDNPGDHGETAYNSYYGGRTIAVNGRIESYTLNKLRDMELALRTAFADTTKERPLYFLTGNPQIDHYINCKKFSKNQIGDEQKDTYNFFRDFVITLRASDPRFLKYQRSIYSVTPSQKSLQVVNFGNFNAKPVFRIYGPVSGNITFNVESDNGKIIQVFTLVSGVTIADGDFYEANIEKNILRDKTGANVFSALDFTSDWPEIYPGENFITFSPGSFTGTPQTANSNTRVEVYFRDSYI